MLALTLLLAFLNPLALALEPSKNIDIFAWPLSAAKPTTLAAISYNTTHANLQNYNAPKLSSDERIVRIGFYPDPSDKETWSGIATSASNFRDSDKQQKKLSLHVSPATGSVSYVGFRAETIAKGQSPKAGKAGLSKDGEVLVEVVKIPAGPAPVLNKPVVVRDDGKVEGEEPEKSFFQKYWWALAGVLVLQLVLSGGGK